MTTKHQGSALRPPGTSYPRMQMPTKPWPLQVGFWLMIGFAAFFLVTEHRAHLVGGLIWLPVLLLLACPLIHMFSHRGHGGHGGHRKNSQDAAGDSPPATPGPDVPADSKASRPHTHGGDLP